MKFLCQMLVFSGACVLLLSAGALGQECMSPDKKRIVYPSKWEAAVFRQDYAYLQKDNRASYKNTVNRVSYDSSLSKVAATTSVMDMSSTVVETYRTVEDWTQKISWLIQGKNCTKHALTEGIVSPCMPAEGQFLQDGGLYGDIAGTTWASRHGDVTSRLTISENCLLLTCSSLSNSKDSEGNIVFRMDLYNFQNQTLGIADPSVFDLPDSCKH